MPRSEGAARAARAAGATGAAVALALAARLAYGRGFVGYDGFYSLVWGRQLAAGRAPDYSAANAPTPHPLANVLSVLLSPWSHGAPGLLLALASLSVGLLALLAFGLARQQAGPLAGALAAAILLTRPENVFATREGLIDVPFLDLVLGGAICAQLTPARPRAALALLALAGLLRPEAWALALAYGGWLLLAGPASEGRPRRSTVALVVAAPSLWLGVDLLTSGDALHSLHATRDLTRQLGRPTGLDSALRLAPRYLKLVLGTPMALGGVAGALLALWASPRRSAVGLALLGLGLGAFVALGLAGLPLLTRYLQPAMAMVTVFFAFALLGWRGQPRGWRRLAWQLLAVVLVVAVALDLPSQRRQLRAVTADEDARVTGAGRLATLVESVGRRGGLRACPRLEVPEFLEVPVVAYYGDRLPRDVAVVGAAATPAGPAPSGGSASRWQLQGCAFVPVGSLGAGSRRSR